MATETKAPPLQNAAVAVDDAPAQQDDKAPAKGDSSSQKKKPEPSRNPPKSGGGVRGAIEAVGQGTLDFIDHIGRIALMLWEVAKVTFLPPYRFRLLFESMEEVGVGSLFIVLLTGLFTGMVMSLQGVIAFSAFNAETLVGGSTAVVLSRELSPVLAGLMVSGRSGSAMATTLGTMRVTEQIDAMEVMAVSSMQYLVMPRIIAAIFMMPLLTLLFDFVGMGGAYLVAVEVMGVDGGIFVAKIKDFVAPMDIVKGAIKAACFGASIAVLSCYRGFYAAGGAKGVGEATTSAVVLGSISILVLNYFLDLILW